MFKTLTFAVLLSGAATLAASAESLCLAHVNAQEIVVDRDLLGDELPKASLARRALGWPARKLESLGSEYPECEPEILIRSLAMTVPEDEVEGYCLAEDPEQGWLLVPGERGSRGRCSKTACERVNGAKTAAIGTAVKAIELSRGPDPEEAEDDAMGAVLHSSGAAILKGSSSYILGALGSAASGAGAALSTPAVLAAASVSLVAVGGAVYLCSE